MTTRRLDADVDGVDQALTHALEAIPHVAIADDFAARVMSRVPARKAVPGELPARVSVGRRVSLVAAALLLVAMLVFPVQTGAGNAAMRTAAEWTLALEFAALAAWLSMRPSESR